MLPNLVRHVAGLGAGSDLTEAPPSDRAPPQPLLTRGHLLASVPVGHPVQAIGHHEFASRHSPWDDLSALATLVFRSYFPPNRFYTMSNLIIKTQESAATGLPAGSLAA